MPLPPIPSLFVPTPSIARGPGDEGATSMLGLERSAGCRQAAIEAIARGEVCLEALEASLEALWQRPVAVRPSSALEPSGVLLALGAEADPVLISPAMASRHQRALQALARAGWSIETAPAEPEALAARLAAFCAGGRRGWYVEEAFDARSGAWSDFERLRSALERCPGLHVLLDGTYDVGWNGDGGRGLALEALTSERVMLLADLAPTLGAPVGAVACGDRSLRDAVRLAADGRGLDAWRLGCAMAVAERLASEGEERQMALFERMHKVARLVGQAGLARLAPLDTPFVFVAAGNRSVAFEAAGRLLADGHAVTATTAFTPSGFEPALRFEVSLGKSIEAQGGLVSAIARHLGAALDAAGTSLEALRLAHLGARGPASAIDMAAWRAMRSARRGTGTPG